MVNLKIKKKKTWRGNKIVLYVTSLHLITFLKHYCNKLKLAFIKFFQITVLGYLK